MCWFLTDEWFCRCKISWTSWCAEAQRRRHRCMTATRLPPRIYDSCCSVQCCAEDLDVRWSSIGTSEIRSGIPPGGRWEQRRHRLSGSAESNRAYRLRLRTNEHEAAWHRHYGRCVPWLHAGYGWPTSVRRPQRPRNRHRGAQVVL